MVSLTDKAKETVVDTITNMPKPTAELTDVNIRGVTRDAIGLKSDVLLHNPYDCDLPILEVTYRLRCGDREITSGSIGQKAVGAVSANSDTKLEVGNDVEYNFLITLMRDIGSDWDID